MSDALDYIENNLCEEMTQEAIAATCYCSLSSLQKMFRYTFGFSLGEYITKRRLTSATRELVETSNSILDIAVKYCYNSPEVFTRAFRKLWHVSPSEFRKTRRFSGIHPRLDYDFNGGNIMTKKKYDISELYDCIKSRKGKYIISFDMVHLMPINDTYGFEAGDKAILECLKRLEEAANDSCVMFRIGGDEFVIVTDTDKPDEVRAIAEIALSHNEETVSHNGTDIPVAMRAAAIKLTSDALRYSELFNELVKISKRAELKDEMLHIYD